MFERPNPLFEPSGSTREAMLYVRKKPFLVSGIQHPGLFGIHGYTPDWVMFLLVLVLEAIGLYSFYNALEQSDTSIFTALMATGAMLVVDFVLAYYHHRFATGINAKLEIQNILDSKYVGEESNIAALNNQDLIRSRKNKSFIFSTLLILLAAVKFGVFYMLNEGSGEIEYGVVAFMAVAYLLAAIIHVKVTGYLLHAVWANWLHHRDVESYKSSNGKTCAATEYIENLTHFPDFEQGLSVRSLSILQSKKPGSDDPAFILKSVGMIMDKDIEEMAYKIRNDNARTHFALKAMELQIRMV